jgi:hypothetical protein
MGRSSPLVTPWPLKPAAKGGLTIDDFTDDATTTTSTLACPGDVTRTVSPQGR